MDVREVEEALVGSLDNLFAGITPQRNTIPVAVVVVGKDPGKYLSDCFESIDRQEPGPAEVCYVDNGSANGAAAWARRRKISVIALQRPQSVGLCRNCGVLATRSPYLVFMDADDALPSGYLKSLFDKLSSDERLGLVYPPWRRTGLLESSPFSSAAWGRDMLLRENFIPLPAMIKRQALSNTGDWLMEFDALNHWEMWLRLSAQGWLFKQIQGPVFVDRTTPQTRAGSFEQNIVEYQDILRRQPLTVFTPFGPGRPITGKRYFKTLEALGLDWGRVTLFFYDNTCSKTRNEMLQQYLYASPARGKIYYRDDTYVTFHDAHSRAMTMPYRMAEMWMRAGQMFNGDFVLTLEDDIEPHEPYAGTRLYEGMAPDVDMVVGHYFAKPVIDQCAPITREWFIRPDGALSLRLPTWYLGDSPHEPSDGLQSVGATGVGLGLIRRETIENFEYPVGQMGCWIGQDFGIARHIRERGRRLMVHWGLRCKHWHKPDEHV